ncbi:ABC transporter permease [Spirochaeta dissipatitropha]
MSNGRRGLQYLLGFISLTVMWYLAAAYTKSPALPFPHRIASEILIQLSHQEIYRHIASSLFRMFSGTSLALAAGIPIGIILGRLKQADSIVSPMLYFLYPIPKISLLPVLMIFLGIGELPKITLIALIVVFPIILSVRDAVIQLSGRYLELARMLDLSAGQIISRIICPGILPRVLSSIRVSLGIALSALFFAENLATSYGLGYFIMNSWIMAHYVRMYSGILILGLTGIILYSCLDILEKLTIPWIKHT